MFIKRTNFTFPSFGLHHFLKLYLKTITFPIIDIERANTHLSSQLLGVPQAIEIWEKYRKC